MANPTTSAATAAPPVQTTPATAVPAKADAIATPSAAEIRKLKLKLDGQDVELPENEVIALAQQGKVAGKRFQEAAAIRKKAEDILKFAQENPREFFAKTGLDARKFAEEYLIEELKKEQMSPEQRKAAENEAKLKKYEDERKAEIERKKREDEAALQAHHAENYNKLFIEALTKSGLPRTPYTVKRMAELQLVNIKKKLELGADQLAKVVREDYMAEQKALFGAYDGDQLLDFLGPEIAKKLSKAQIAKLKAKGLRTAGPSSKAQSNAGTNGMSWREYQKRNRRLT